MANNEFYERIGDTIEFQGSVGPVGVIVSGAVAEVNVSIPGCLAGAGIMACPTSTLGNANILWCAWAPTDGNVFIRIFNPTGGPVTPNTVDWKIYARLPRSRANLI